MTCKECGIEVVEVGGKITPANGEVSKVILEYKVPFCCGTCGGLKFPYRALNGIVFIWAKPIPEYKGMIFIPERERDNFKSSLGMVLSSGKGCKHRRTGKYMESELSPGDVVLYDKSIPWNMQITATDGKEYKVEMANMFDVNALVGEND